MERFANEISAVTLVMMILKKKWDYILITIKKLCKSGKFVATAGVINAMTYLPSNLCLRKSNRAFCIMSVTSYPFSEGPIRTTGRMEGTTS